MQKETIMGLDQFAHILEQGEDFENLDRSSDFYWRKHNRLQGWMANLWADRTGHVHSPEEFNCTPLELTSEDIEKLAQAIENSELPKTGGFFFGRDSYEDYVEYGGYDRDCRFIAAAREALKEGKRVIYFCSW
jgi:hypothetical protein